MAEQHFSLRDIDIFSSFSEPELEVLSEYSCYNEYKEGESVFLEGEKGSSLFLVDRGEIVIRRMREHAGELVLASYKPGHSFGELDLLTSGIHSADAVAAEETTLLQFPCPGVKFKDILQKHPSISARILHKLLVFISGRIRTSNTLIKENSPLVQELRRQLYGDKLTGLYNKTYLEENLGSFLSEESSTALLMFKPDNFKAINDTYGHEIGDGSLKLMSRQLSASVGEAGVCVRYMGNEMAVILPNTEREKALETAEMIQEDIYNMDLSPLFDDGTFHLTTSFGISLCPEYTRDPVELVALAHELPLVGRGRGGSLILFPEDKEENPHG